MNEPDAIRLLDGLDTDDPERAHSLAERYILELLEASGHGGVVAAYKRLADRCPWWP